MQLPQAGGGRDMAPWTALATTSKSGGPLKSSCVTLNEPHNLSEYQFILNYTDVTVSAATRGTGASEGQMTPAVLRCQC